jgi:undecaprenyl diphosphate synthase
VLFIKGVVGMWRKLTGQKKETSGNEALKHLNIKNLDMVDFENLPKHIAIIMDGNGRWAKQKGLPRFLGHRQGAKTVKTIVRTASDIGIKVLTIYAFSTENWKRPQEEVDILMQLFSEFLDNEIEELHTENVQIRFIGIVVELAASLQREFENAEARTEKNTGLVLNIAVNYGSRSEITRAVKIIAEKAQSGEIAPLEITESTVEKYLYTAGLPDPDLLIRPSGDFRISNYLLWQLAYAEFWFTDTNWPDFTPETLVDAIISFQKRERRFGGLRE